MFKMVINHSMQGVLKLIQHIFKDDKVYKDKHLLSQNT